jgi:hypothetical protein
MNFKSRAGILSLSPQHPMQSFPQSSPESTWWMNEGASFLSAELDAATVPGETRKVNGW